MSIIKSIKQVLGLGPAAENHFWDGSVPNQLSLKRGTPEAPGAEVLKVENGKTNFTAGIFGFSITTTNTGGGTQYCLQFPSWLNTLKIQWGNQSVASGTIITFAVPFTTNLHAIVGSPTPLTVSAYVDVVSFETISSGSALNSVKAYVSRYSGVGPSWTAGSSQCNWIAIGY